MRLRILALMLLSGICMAQGPAVSIGGSIGVTGGASLQGQLSLVSMTDADYTLVPVQWWVGTLVVPSSVTLSATRKVVVPLNKGQQYIVTNNSTGGQSIVIGGATGLGVTVINGQTVVVDCVDGANYVLATPPPLQECNGIGCPYHNQYNAPFSSSAALVPASIVSPTDTTITVTSASVLAGYPSTAQGGGCLAFTGGEIACYTTISGAVISGITRGLNGTTPVSIPTTNNFYGIVTSQAACALCYPSVIISNTGQYAVNGASPGIGFAYQVGSGANFSEFVQFQSGFTSASIGTSNLLIYPMTYSSIGSCTSSPLGNEGTMRPITDGNVNTWGATISSGGGSYHVLAYCDGTNWTVAAQ